MSGHDGTASGGDHIAVWTTADRHDHGHQHVVPGRGLMRHSHPHDHHGDGQHLAADPHHKHLHEDIGTLQPVITGPRPRGAAGRSSPARAEDLPPNMRPLGVGPVNKKETISMSGRTAYNLNALSSSFRGVPLSEVAAKLGQDAARALREAGLTGDLEDGTEVVLSAADLAAMADGREVRMALSHVGDGPVYLTPEPGGQYDDDLYLTPADVELAELELTAATGAGLDPELDDDVAAEVLRYTQLHQADQLRAAGHRVPREWGTMPRTPVGLTRETLDDAVCEVSGFNRSVPTDSTSWARPAEDWKRTCRCELTNSEYANHVCPSARPAAGERALALGRLAIMLGTGSPVTYDVGFEAARLAARHGEEFGLAHPGDGHSHLHYHTGALHPHTHAHTHDDEVHGHGHSDSDQREAHGLLQRPVPGDASDAEAQRYLDMADAMGIGRVTNYHGKPGSGRPVTSGTRAHKPETEHITDRSQPRRPNVPYPGVEGYDGGMGGAEEISRRHPEMFGGK